MIPAIDEKPRLSAIGEFADAESHGARADILLRMPLIIIHDYRFVLQATCKATGFTPGEDYIREVVDALFARRDAAGAFKGDVADRVAMAGVPLQEMADQWRPVSEADGTCRSRLPCECPPTRAAREKCPAWRWKR